MDKLIDLITTVAITAFLVMLYEWVNMPFEYIVFFMLAMIYVEITN